jgi:LmbE family N-acetylglucosaminyl deacetylase
MKKIYLLLAILLIAHIGIAQTPKKITSSDIHENIKKLNVLANAFYIAAHPDDENTRMISLLANQYKANVYYLSCTRGDGGQNLIGPEIEDLLGVIRTNELLAARGVDGGNQLFTRANDFGYSKNTAETQKIWNRQEVLSDIVWQIRNYKPDIIINRFNNDPNSDTHGHHTTSAILSTEAFDLTNKKDAFPEQLKLVEPWQAKRLYFNTFWWFYGSEEAFNKLDKSKMVTIDAGPYFPWLGKSNGEIASESRSMHKCQGMGAAGNRGSSNEYLDLLKGEPITSHDNPFAGIDISWNRVKGGAVLIPLITDVDKKFQYDNPAASIPKLNKIYQMIQGLPDTYWKKIKSEEIKNIIQQCAGLFIEASSANHAVAPGENNTFTAELINRSKANVVLKSVKFVPLENADTVAEVILQNNKDWKFSRTVKMPKDIPTTGHYWLNQTRTQGMYIVPDQKLRGLPLTPRSCKAVFVMNIEGTEYTVEKDIVYKWVDPAKTEIYRPFEIIAPAFVNLDSKVYVYADESPKKVTVIVKSGVDKLSGDVSLTLPKEWRSEPLSLPVQIKSKGYEQGYSFLVYPPKDASEGDIKAKIVIDGKAYENETVVINYDHIPYQLVQRPGISKLLKLNIQKGPDKIAYINGAGDEVANCLEQIGYHVTVIADKDINADALSRYDAVIMGIRAYNTVDRLKNVQPVLMDYVQRGGNLIVQYNTNSRMVTQDIGPYPLKLSRERVSQENAEMRFLLPEHVILNSPNKITAKDFEHWVQERGLYYPSEWDKKQYDAVLSSNDEGEPARDGGLLVAKYGDGNFVYTSLSFFRELPSGVSGAYRLFANMLALKKNAKS